MADGALEPLLDGMAARAAGRAVPLTPLLVHEAATLENALARDEWTFGPAGSKNTPMWAAAALGRWDLIARECLREAEQGLWCTELGSPGVYLSGVQDAKMLALRELERTGQAGQAAAVRRVLRAMLAWDALIAVPAGRLHDRVLIAGRVVESASPQLVDGLTVAIAGNRYTPEIDRNRDGLADGGLTTDDAHSGRLAMALDWTPRASRGPRVLKGALADVLRVQRYTASTPPEPWGLSAEDRALLRLVVDGGVNAARLAATTMLLGSKPARGERSPDPWRWRLTRTTLGAECVFFGPWPNPNKPARAATQAMLDGSYVGLQPSATKDAPAEGYSVEVRDGRIYASSAQSNGEHSIPELTALGGELLWQVHVNGLEVAFTAGDGSSA